jgi:hypothetical protein
MKSKLIKILYEYCVVDSVATYLSNLADNPSVDSSNMHINKSVLFFAKRTKNEMEMIGKIFSEVAKKAFIESGTIIDSAASKKRGKPLYLRLKGSDNLLNENLLNGIKNEISNCIER